VSVGLEAKKSVCVSEYLQCADTAEKSIGAMCLGTIGRERVSRYFWLTL
jgi:hypothetical protein